MELVKDAHPTPDIESPRWDQKFYWNRVKHFVLITNPLNIFCTNAQLDDAKRIVEDYRIHKFSQNLTVDQLWRAKQIYDSAFHPDTKEKMPLAGRMSAQVPANMAITGCMLTFYKNPFSVMFWQWFNQSFNALVNYTNRSGSSPITKTELLVSYCGATGGALSTALGLNYVVKSLPPLIGRFVPLCAVGVANCINIPLMRNRELRQGIPLFDEDGNNVGMSKVAGRKAIQMVSLSRVLMAFPGMVIPPILINALEKKKLYQRFKFMNMPLQTLMVGFFLTFATPMGCAIFPQNAAIAVNELEPEVQKAIQQLPKPPKIVYYNKGL